MPRFLSIKTIQLLLLGALFILPFLIPWHFSPDPAFYNKVVPLLVLLILLTIGMFFQSWTMPFPKLSIGLLLLAAYWLLQSRLMGDEYLERSDAAVLFFAFLALLVWWVQSRIQFNEKPQLLSWVAWAVVIGVFLQTLVVIAQITNWAALTYWIAYLDENQIIGQMAQRNHLGHYLMWGAVAVTYLLSTQQIKTWLGWALLIYFAAIIGANNSRTTIAYLLGIAAVLVYVRLVGGRETMSLVKYYVIALVTLLTFQFVTPAVLEFFGREGLSSVERLTQSSPVYRYQEWEKAWEIFKERPLFGYGYGSYAYQGFLKDWGMIADGEPRALGVLFTHCHNMVLQLLAEMGLFGTLLVFGVMLYAALPMLKHPEKPHHILLMVLITVSICHSLLEYPLWYGYFLIPFVIFFALGQEKQDNQSAEKYLPTKMKVVFALPLILGIAVTTMMMVKYTQLAYSYNKTETETQAEAFDAVGQVNMPFMAYKTDQIILMKAKLGSYDIPPEMVTVIDRMNAVYPNGFAGTLHALNLYREGKITASQDWLRRVMRYHPQTTDKTEDYLYGLSPQYDKLEQVVYEMCLYNQKYQPDIVATCKIPPSISVLSPAVDK